MKILNKFILIFIISLNTYAQKDALRFEAIDYDDNFPQSNISKIIQSKKGFIWFGTDNGLVRFDGYNFVRYYTRDKVKGTISNNYIHDIYEDTDGNLWVGTSHGVNLYNKKTNNFTSIDLAPINPTKGGKNYISSFAEDGNHNLWVGTNGGLKKLNKSTYLLENVFQGSNAVLSENRILSIFYDKEFGILVGTNLGLQSFDPLTGLKKKLPEVITRNTTFLKEDILKIVKDENGDMWFATENSGVFMYSKSQNIFNNYKLSLENKNSISSNNVKDVIVVDFNTLWFATDDGLNVFKKDIKKFIRYQHDALIPSSIIDNNVNCLFKDKDDSIWIGTKTGSINIYNKSNSNFTNISESIYPNFGLNNTIVNALVKDKGESLWVGTNGGGLTFLDLKKSESASYQIHSLKSKNIITTLANKDEDNLLCGTIYGLMQFNKKSKKFNNIPINENEIPVSSLLIDKDNLWVGTDGHGLIKVYKNGALENYQKASSTNSISDNYITGLENRDKGLWISTLFGLNYFNKETKQFTTILQGREKNSLSNNTLTTMFTDSKGRLWVGMGYGGLNYFDEVTKKFYLLNESMGLTDGTIKSISEDSQGNLWISSNNLLFQIKIKEFKTPFLKSNFKITSYASKHGINVKNYSTNCSEQLGGNKLAFGGSKGLIIFNPSKIVKSQIKNKIVLTKLRINNEEVKFSEDNSILKTDISEASEINLDYTQKFVGFEFSALNYVNSENNKYAYKLESSFDNDSWHNIGMQNSVNLAGLNPGSYTFKLRSIDENGVLGENVKTIKIHMSPPFWKTNWAYFIYFILLLSILFLIMNFIRSKVIIKQALISKQLESDRQEELYTMKLDFFTNISHEIRTPLTLIQGPVEELLDSCEKDTVLEKKLTTVKKNSDRLLTLINELLDFRKIESKQKKIYCEQQDIIQFCFDIYESFKGVSAQKNIDFKFVMNAKTIPVYFDKKQMEKVIYNLLSNAFKFTKKNGKIVISIEDNIEDDGWIQIKIKDNGIGIPKDSKTNVFKNFFQVDERGHKNKGSGIGLALSKTIVELHHGILSIENEEDSWANTIFKISLQKGEKHLNTSEIVENKITIDDATDSVIIESEELLPKTLIDEDDEDENKKTLLIIDDQKEIRKFISEILIEEYNIVSFCNGQEALDYMEKQIPDLIICDVMMPEMDGFEFCKIIKTNESTNHIPVILLTAKASTQNRIDGLALGADAYITKPFSIKVLKLNIINLLTSKEILRQKYSGSFIVDSDLEKLDIPEEVFIKKLMLIIESNIEKSDFDVKELVKEIGMSRTVLYKKIKTLTNHSVASLIKHIRLKKAADILKSTNYNISEVTYMVGFNDRKHFSKEFKKVYKVSPSDYKNEQTNS